MTIRSYIYAASLSFTILVIPVYLRTQAAASVNLYDVAQDLKSAGLDALVASILILAASLAFGRAVNSAVALLLFLFSLLIVANIEYVSAFDRALEFTQAKYVLDPTFFWGSIARISHPLSLIALLSSVALCFVVGIGISATAFKKMALAFLGSALILVVFVPNNDDALSWRKYGFIQQTAANIWTETFKEEGDLRPIDPGSKVKQAVVEQLELDLRGVPISTLDVGKPNILLIVLESVSGAFLPSLASAHGLESNVKMRELDSFTQAGISFSRFVAHQRQTTRGTYSLLCGDLPLFSNAMPKLEAAALSDTKIECLPELLKQVGYSTHYVQAAPLSFANKNRSLPLIGYDNLKGAEWFGEELVGTGWGLGDGVFFKQAIQEIDELKTKTEPWFLTLLNVGTHHPFDSVPSSFQGSSDPKVRSFEYLDFALGGFFDDLSQNGRLENTLVIVTSDEAGGLEGKAAASVRDIARNWSIMSLIHPSLNKTRVDEVSGQMDLLPTMIDILSLSTPQQAKGRSLLRKYDASRAVYAFHNLNQLVFRFGDDSVTICSVEGRQCREMTQTDRRFRATSMLSEIENIPEELEAVRVLVGEGYEDTTIDLVKGESVVLMEEAGYVICCQYFKASKGNVVALDVEAVLSSDTPTVMTVDVVSNKDGVFTTHYSKVQPLVRGDKVEVKNQFALTEDTDNIEVRLYVDGASELSFSRAETTISDRE